MTQRDFSKLSDEALAGEALNENLGYSRAQAIAELANRALAKPGLLESAVKAIGSDRRMGFHSGPPLGWFGADAIYLSGQERAIRALLREMDNWEPFEQEDLVRHWAGKGRLAVLTRELQDLYGWVPSYQAGS
jgi:hypothetical protein